MRFLIDGDNSHNISQDYTYTLVLSETNIIKLCMNIHMALFCLGWLVDNQSKERLCQLGVSS